jgi:hypothetical protein
LRVRHAYEFDAATLALRDARLRRERGDASVTVTSGFSAVLLPMPDCPPILRWEEDRRSLKAGSEAEVAVRVFAPWRKSKRPTAVTVSVPGLTVSPARLAVPGRFRLKVPPDAEPGWYPLKLSGDCLPVKRWIEVKPQEGRE